MGSRSTFVLCTALPLLSGFRAIRDRLTLDVEGNVRCAGSPHLLATSFSLLPFHFLAPPLSKLHVVANWHVTSLLFAKLTNKRPDYVSSRHFKFCCNATGLVNRLSLEPGPQYIAMYPQRTLSAT